MQQALLPRYLLPPPPPPPLFAYSAATESEQNNLHHFSRIPDILARAAAAGRDFWAEKYNLLLLAPAARSSFPFGHLFG
jgi:hypothetical protein